MCLQNTAFHCIVWQREWQTALYTPWAYLSNMLRAKWFTVKNQNKEKQREPGQATDHTSSNVDESVCVVCCAVFSCACQAKINCYDNNQIFHAINAKHWNAKIHLVMRTKKRLNKKLIERAFEDFENAVHTVNRISWASKFSVWELLRWLFVQIERTPAVQHKTLSLIQVYVIHRYWSDTRVALSRKFVRHLQTNTARSSTVQIHREIL